MSITSNVAVILATDPETRDNFDKLYKQYFFIYGDCTPEDFFKTIPSINTARKTLQNKFTHLQGEKRSERMICCNKFKSDYNKHKNQGQYEDLSDMFPPIKEKQSSWKSLKQFFNI